jgi:hypothetical protein
MSNSQLFPLAHLEQEREEAAGSATRTGASLPPNFEAASLSDDKQLPRAGSSAPLDGQGPEAGRNTAQKVTLADLDRILVARGAMLVKKDRRASALKGHNQAEESAMARIEILQMKYDDLDHAASVAQESIVKRKTEIRELKAQIEGRGREMDALIAMDTLISQDCIANGGEPHTFAHLKDERGRTPRWAESEASLSEFNEATATDGALLKLCSLGHRALISSDRRLGDHAMSSKIMFRELAWALNDRDPHWYVIRRPQGQGS